MNELEIIEENFQEMRHLLGKLENQYSNILKTVDIIYTAIKRGNKVILFGNGGSAADAQHFAAELSGKFKYERRGLPAMSLTTNTSTLTAIANDFGYDKVFERQVEALGRDGDVLIGITTSGNSPNVLKAFEYGLSNNMTAIGLVGGDGGRLSDRCSFSINVPSKDTPKIQELHIMIIHLICGLVEQRIVDDDK